MTVNKIISAGDITKSFGTLQVLRGVEFSAAQGEVVAITGASGAGKTTLQSRELAAFRCRRIGFVFQFHHLLPEFTALENVMIPALIAGRSSKDASAAALALLENVGLAARSSHKPSELSGGEQQRVAIARALINRPAVLFADEPTGNLDSATKEEIHRLFFRLRDTLGQTIVIVTHDPSLAALCDRTLTMRDGEFL